MAAKPRMTPVAFLLQAAPWTPLDVRRGSVADISVRIRSKEDEAALGQHGERDADAEECLVWQFELEEYDIGFQLLENGIALGDLVRYKAGGNVGQDGKATDSPTKSKVQEVLEQHTMNDHVAWIESYVDGLKPGGTYTFRWDNSYSLVRHKQLQYRFLVTSKRAFAAAQTAAQEANEKHLQEAKKNRWSGSLKPHLARKLARDRGLSTKESAAEQNDAIESLQQCVTDMVAAFMTKPDSPLYEGSVRPFILALETVLRHGIKESFLNEWPEEPYYEFLLETGTVLRDDQGLVAEVKPLSPPETLQHIGWTRARAFLFIALNKKILHRAFENLTKRRMLVERYYEPHALLFTYANATQIASFLSALNAVTFLLAPFPDETQILEDPKQIPPNLLQCTPEAPLLGKEKLKFRDGINADSSLTRGILAEPDVIKQVQNCSLPRYLCHELPFQEVHIGRGSVVFVPLDLKDDQPVLVIQLQVLFQDINVSIANDDEDELAEPVLVSATDMWTEGIFRVKTKFKPCLSIKLDNSFAIVRGKQVKLRYRVASEEEYTCAWEACIEMAQSISWKQAAASGAERCEQYMESLHQKEEEELTAQRNQEAATKKSEAASGTRVEEESILGIPTSLISNPVSYLVGGILSSDANSFCAQCLAPFSFFTRQHQCPLCQSVVCVPCSRHYVQVNGKGPHLKTCDRCFLKEKDNERKRRGNMTGQSTDQSECAAYAALRRDPAMEKYFKMLGFGVPASGVAQKMMQDDVELEKIQVFSAGPSGPTSSLFPLAGRREGTGPPKLARRRSSSLRKVHWTSLEAEKASESIWTRVTARRKTAPITLSPQDFQELEQLFGDSSVPKGASKEKKSGGVQKKNFSALDSRRSNNISIGLSQFKALGGIEAIIKSLKDCDFNFLTTERLTNLYDIAPTSVEVKRYTDFRGSRARLDISERFLVEMCEIPRVTEKFNHQQNELRDRVQVITRACYEILHSERLARCFELVLAIGNLLNSGTELEDARGITLASLLKLSETKSMDRSMTLLQFIIKLIHDRGEGDILLFINELNTLADAKRFSNIICASQFKALHSSIQQLENEIKEEMVNDLKRFRKEEQRRKEQFEQQSRTPIRRPPLFNGVARLPGSSSPSKPNARNSLLDAIRKRGGNKEGKNANAEKDANPKSSSMMTGADSRAALMAAIQKRQQATMSEPSATAVAAPATEMGNRSMLMEAIKSRQLQASVSGEEEEQRVEPSATNARSALMNAIAKRGQVNSDVKESEQNGVPENPRAALFAAITQRKQQSSNAEGAQAPVSSVQNSNGHSTLLASIRQRQSTLENKESSSSQEPPVNPQAALLAAIRGGLPKEPLNQDSSVPMATSDDKSGGDAQFVPRDYKMESKFISDMRQRLLEIKTAYEDLEMELETMNSAWEATARYLGEDLGASSSEYIFNLLNRFRLDVKVVKTLLFRKGLSFANDLQALLPNAHVGNTVATVYGPGVVTALRVADKRIEIKFPWSREAYLSPSCVLSAGSLVRCRVFGVGIIRQTHYDVGFCCVRFSFGYGMIQVQEITPETSSNASSLRQEILDTPFCVGDPVLTPFGCGYVKSIELRSRFRGSYQQQQQRVEANPDGILAVHLLASEMRAEERGQENYAGTAFVQFRHATLNY
uniref:FH2 domain-containing protein n=1 Tax=Globisporangium ultimum (strain ATCC 200006 / CBS 805.95 / DAOM BR144) TaxID=431595 RepID=K3WPW1_GLOUD